MQVHEVIGRSEKARRQHQFTVSYRKLQCSRSKINRRKCFFSHNMLLNCGTLLQDVPPPGSIGGGGTNGEH